MRRFAVLSTLVLLVGVIPGTGAVATSGTLVIGADTTLTEDHFGSIVIDDDDVTLDCAGYSVVGPDAFAGISVVNRTDVTVSHCVVSGFTVGIVVDGSTGTTLENNTSSANSNAGFRLLQSSDSSVTSNVAKDNGLSGFFLNMATDNAFTSNASRDNLNGFLLISGSAGNLLDGNVAVNNGGSGFHLDNPGTSGNTLRHNIADSNGFVGYLDETVDTGDFGTANFYFDNSCVRNVTAGSNPAGLCGRFADDGSGPFENDTEWMAEQGITLGCNPEGTLYCTGDPVTRGQMASFLVRALDLPAVPGNRFSDVSGTHTANINALAEAGVTLGCNAEGTLFCPTDLVTRAQMGSFLARALDLAPIPGDRFSDVSGSHEPNINAIAEAGITLGCNPEGTLYCPSDNVTRGQMAAFLHRALG